MDAMPTFTVMDADTDTRLASVLTTPNETLYAAATRVGIRVRTRCRASAICGLCWVDVLESDAPLDPPRPDEAQLLDAYASGSAPRLACRLKFPAGATEVKVAATGWSRG